MAFFHLCIFLGIWAFSASVLHAASDAVKEPGETLNEVKDVSYDADTIVAKRRFYLNTLGGFSGSNKLMLFLNRGRASADKLRGYHQRRQSRAAFDVAHGKQKTKYYRLKNPVLCRMSAALC